MLLNTRGAVLLIITTDDCVCLLGSQHWHADVSYIHTLFSNTTSQWMPTHMLKKHEALNKENTIKRCKRSKVEKTEAQIILLYYIFI